jgi:hypothetical protein
MKNAALARDSRDQKWLETIALKRVMRDRLPSTRPVHATNHSDVVRIADLPESIRARFFDEKD